MPDLLTSQPAGALRERLRIQQNVSAKQALSGLTRSGTVATAVLAAAHGFAVGDYVRVAGASPAGYNGDVKIASVPLSTSFTYPVVNTLTTPATGTITAQYLNDKQGGRKDQWTDLATVWAELLPVSAMERLQLSAINSGVIYRFRIKVRGDLTAAMRAIWTPRWPPSSPGKTLAITGGILPEDDGRRFVIVTCTEAPS